MIVIDTSAILAIILEEPDGVVFARAIKQATRRLVPASVALETSIVLLTRGGEKAFLLLDEFIREVSIEVAQFNLMQVWIAREAYVRFGKGRHRAALNFGDCMSYALAKTEAMPLLFKGDDFGLTDIEAAL